MTGHDVKDQESVPAEAHLPDRYIPRLQTVDNPMMPRILSVTTSERCQLASYKQQTGPIL